MDEGNRVSREEILPLLNKFGPKANGGWVMFHCPVAGHGQGHGDKDRSAGLSNAGVLKCFISCSFKDLINALRAANGVSRERRSQERPLDIERPREQHVRKWGGDGNARIDGYRLVQQYEYTDLEGNVVAEKGRFERPNPSADKGYDKEFAWRVPGGRYAEGLSKFGLSVDAIPLWGAAELQLAEAGQRVWFVEGEAATEAVRARNELCLCGGWGAGQKNYGDSLNVLRGRTVYLWPDNDQPGREYMASVSASLRGIAKKVIVVDAPTPPKGDAVDYFRAGGTIEALLENVLTEPTVDVYGDDRLAVRIPTTRGILRFLFDGLVRSRKSLDGEVEVTLSAALAPEPFWQRIDLASSSNRSALILALKKHFGECGEATWDSLVNTAYSRVRDAFKQVNPATLTYGNMTQRSAEFVLEPFIVEQGGTMAFGEPKKGKSTVCLLMAVAVDAGVWHSELPWRVPRQRRVLYLNLERSEGSMSARLARVNVIMGLEETRPLLFIHARGRPLEDILDRVREAIREMGVELVILDSISRAGYGDLNDNRTANRVVDALNSLGVAWVGIGHTPRGDDSHIFGSVHQEAGADVMLGIASERAMDGSLGISMVVTAANDISIPRPAAFKLLFDGMGLRDVSGTQDGEFVSLEGRGNNSPLERVKTYLGANGQATIRQISEDTGVPPHMVSTLIKAGLGREFVRIEDFSKGGEKQTRFALKASEPPVQPTPIYKWDGNEEKCELCGGLIAGLSPEGKPRCRAHHKGGYEENTG